MRGRPIVLHPSQIGSNIPPTLPDVPMVDIESRNVIFLRGSFSSRAGWAKIQNISNNIIGLYDISDGTAPQLEQLWAGAPDTIYWFNFSNNTFTSLKGSNNALTATDANAVRFGEYVTAGGIRGIVATNNTDKPVRTAVGDTQWTVLTNAPIARTTCTIIGRSVFGNTVEGSARYAARVRWSAQNDNTTYPALAYADLSGTSDGIVDVRMFNRTVFSVFKEHSQWLGVAQPGSDAAAFTFELVDRQVGPIGPNAVCDGARGIQFYIGRDGNIYLFDGMQAQIFYRLSDAGYFLDMTRQDNNAIAFDSNRNSLHLSIWIWNIPIDTSGLVQVIVDPGVSRLVLLY
jgi:hypothetical protein